MLVVGNSDSTSIHHNVAYSWFFNLILMMQDFEKLLNFRSYSDICRCHAFEAFVSLSSFYCFNHSSFMGNFFSSKFCVLALLYFYSSRVLER